MAKQARKNKYEALVQPNLALISEMARTMTEKQIAESLGVSYRGIWSLAKREHPELVEAIKRGRQNLVAELRSSLIKKALGYEYTETKEIKQKVNWSDEMYVMLLEAGFTEDQINQAELIKTETYHKHASPDVAAINLALKNYDSDNWANDPQALELKKKELALKEKVIKQNDW